MADFGIILLAAGNASRMGRPKQLLDFGGVPLVRHAAVEALGSGCAPVVVVCGAEREAVAEALAGLPVELAYNERWAEGMGTSIQCGLRQLEASGRGAALAGMILSLADQPLLDSHTFLNLLAIHRETRQPIVTSEYSGTVGVPVLFTREIFRQLMALPPAQGCKGVIQRNAALAARMDCPEALADIDTPEDYQRVLAAFVSRRGPAVTGRATPPPAEGCPSA